MDTQERAEQPVQVSSELNAMLGDPEKCFAFCKRHGIRIVECKGKGNEGLYDWISKDDASENPFASKESAAFNAWLLNFEKDDPEWLFGVAPCGCVTAALADVGCATLVEEFEEEMERSGRKAEYMPKSVGMGALRKTCTHGRA